MNENMDEDVNELPELPRRRRPRIVVRFFEKSVFIQPNWKPLKSPRKRIFGWGINDTLRKRSRYEDENESLLIENSAQIEEKKKDCDLIEAVKVGFIAKIGFAFEPTSAQWSLE